MFGYACNLGRHVRHALYRFIHSSLFFSLVCLVYLSFPKHVSASSVMPLSMFLGSLLLSLCEVTLTLYSSYVGVYLLTFLTSAQGNDSSFSA